MANYAVIQDNIVTNVIVADSKEIAEEVAGFLCIEYTEENPTGIGWAFNPELNVFVNPNAVVEEPVIEEPIVE
jgi:hypothetical protein